MTTPREERERELDAPLQRRGRIPADSLSNRLMLARRLEGLTVSEAAARCGFGRGAWIGWEKGARPLDYLDMTGVIAAKLDVDVDWLRFGGSLAGPKGREVSKRTGGDTLWYSRQDVRPTSARPSDGRPNSRCDTRWPGVGRPVIIDGPTRGRDGLVAATA